MQSQRETRKAIPYLRDWRLHRLLTQDKLAEVAGIGRDTVFRLERPDQRANELTIHKIAKALDVSVRQLLEELPPEKECAA